MIAQILNKRKYNWDYFAHQPSFKVGMNEGQETLIGQIMTVFLVLVLISLFVMFGQEMINRKNPRVFQSQSFVEIPETIEFSPSTNQIMFGLVSFDDWLAIDNTGLFNVVIIEESSRIVDREFIIERREYQAELCDVNKHFAGQPIEVMEFFKKIEISWFFCSPENLKIGGNVDISDYYNIYISFRRCSGPGCKSEEETAKILDQTFLSFYTTTTTIDQSNSENPFLQNIRYIWGIASLGMRKHMSILYSSNQVSIDQGFLLEDIATQKSYMMNSYQQFTIAHDQSNQFYIINIEMGNEANKYFFSYQKIQEVFADVQGVTDILIALLLVIIPHFSKAPYYSLLGSNLFTFSYGQSSMIKEGQLREETKIYPYLKNPNQFLNIPCDNKIQQESKHQDYSHSNSIKDFFKTEKNLMILRSENHSQTSQSELITSNQDDRFTVTNLESSSNLNFQDERKNQTFKNQFKRQKCINPILIGTDCADDVKGKNPETNDKQTGRKIQNSTNSILKIEHDKKKTDFQNQLFQKVSQNSALIKIENIKKINNKKYLAQAVEEEINFSCDIIRILQAIYDLDLLKKLTLPTDLYHLFPFLTNDKLNLNIIDEDQNSTFALQKIDQQQQRILRAFNSYQIMKQQEESSRIPDLLRPEILQVFQEIELIQKNG